MNAKFKLALVLAAIGLVAGAFMFTGGDAQARQTQYQSANMFDFDDPTNLIPGAATLTRTKKDISFGVYTSELTPGNAYTVWIVIFNKPENCVDGCDGPDLSTPAVKGSIVYGAGYIAGANGTGSFQGSLKRGSPPAGIEVNVPVGTADGLKNSFKSEIHLVVRDHGAVAEGQAVQQLSTFETDCEVCADIQAVVFDSIVGNNGDDEDD